MAINSKLLRGNDYLREAIHDLSRIRACTVANEIENYLQTENRMIDIGAGNCNVCEALMNKGFDVTPVDIKNLSLVETINPVIYDGKALPFENDKFDVALLAFVLHHCPDPEKTLAEAKRVAKRIIIFEDIYSSIPHKYFTYFLDSVLNQQFFDHPHSNKSDSQWKSLFGELKLDIKATRYEYWGHLIRHATYHVQKL